MEHKWKQHRIGNRAPNLQAGVPPSNLTNHLHNVFACTVLLPLIWNIRYAAGSLPLQNKLSKSEAWTTDTLVLSFHKKSNNIFTTENI